ncbi:glycerol-3-phosphate dehydrogenase/oxidase [Halalkalibacterium halodurans]|jgi:glycerol-3-phosphate dehydrogenase|uniref:Glycerol-3-phosphate dehydrogenase n=1 Tax=Halalkalibacterium halodurans TaxID=86665 RepID=A0A0M0KMH1_ALKHA|nr:glycerol-3-phosphate dehydrogenase/oxidase [Halalkalibacterium halodurans]MED3645477.1 glycerol-3-phosphate dehydrogenase/oxidase [Halalkalibacterium halodurans]TPE70750.1 glycerol-3-phosphate dehydrogenase/oxidase [Halalkalibacterium halodurans]
MFSAKKRDKCIGEMSEKQLDLLVIGGGITGAGIALDAQVRGIQTGLVEMNDFASGTSSRSTKLVHGGLRYLKQFEIKLVAEVGKERAIVYENAPHVTTPEWMLLPIFKDGTFGKFSTSLGLKVYDYLADVRKDERRYMLNEKQTLEKEPLLRKENLKGGGIYVEYRTDDARLTLEIMKEAVARGAVALNYMKVESFIYDQGKVVGVVAKDRLTDTTHTIYAKKVVNAAGPWVDTLREKDRSKHGKYLKLSKGVHLVVDQSRFPLRQAVYFDTESDGRMIFAIPREGKTYIGTTDTFYDKDIASPRMTVEDRDYILAAANYMFPSLNLTADDVESSWAGLRPLIHEEGKKASEISRKDEIFFSDSGLISIAGGKLTGYRKMAERTVDAVAQGLNVNEPCTTAAIRLSGGLAEGAQGFPRFLDEASRKGAKLGFDADEVRRLAKLYGSNVDHVLNYAHEGKEEAEHYGLPALLLGQLQYGVEQEMVATPLDFFVRRTGALFFNISLVHQWKEAVLRWMAEEFSWTEEEKTRFQKELEIELKMAVDPLFQVEPTTV